MAVLRLSLLLLLASVLTVFMSVSAGAISLNPWVCITGNTTSDCGIGEAQLSGSAVASNGNALLTITMSGASAGVVEQVFIESSIVSAISFQGSVAIGIVAFAGDGSPGNLPGGNQPGVDFTTVASASANNPAPKNGIGRHLQDDTSPQSGQFLLTLSGGDFNDLLSDLRIGVHVTGYASGGSESFVTTIPEPGTLLMLGLGVVGLAAARRRRSLH